MKKIEQYLQNVNFAQFISNDMLMDAVLRQMEIVGEAARNVSEELKAQNPAIPWHRMIGMRNFISHEYFGIDLATIWKTASENIPETMPAIKSLMGSIKE
jgi:uncharacterized protein with HEPN domain